jgi:TRAP-type mannitol/chloroaromatic compound transport system permease small subunit
VINQPARPVASVQAWFRRARRVPTLALGSQAKHRPGTLARPFVGVASLPTEFHLRRNHPFGLQHEYPNGSAGTSIEQSINPRIVWTSLDLELHPALTNGENHNMRALLGLSVAINTVLRVIAHAGAWFFLACIITICFDVVTRKFGWQLSIGGVDLGSTRLQELEWHFHAFLFLTWLGYAYVKDAHVRIDVATGGLSPRSQAWLELFGCCVFALPYLIMALPHAHNFFVLSFQQWEGSAAPNGLGMRWIVKGFLYFGFISVLMAVISVMCRRIVYLFGSLELAEQAMPNGVGKAH